MFSAKNISIRYGSNILINNISFSLLTGDKVALVGQNGCGKSSLLNLIYTGKSDDGNIESNKNLKIGLLSQTPNLNEEHSVIEAVKHSMKEVMEDIALHQKLCENLADNHEKNQDKLSQQIEEIASRIELKGGFNVEHRLLEVLHRLGIKAREQKIATLSGGEKRRVDLACLLLSMPDLYLLDEPTNHLDMEAINYLTEIFLKLKQPVLFVSHDTAFIDAIATNIFELCSGKLYTHKPLFSNYLEHKLIRETVEKSTLHKKERLLAQEIAWLRAGTKARTTKQNARKERAHQLIDEVLKNNEEQKQKELKLNNESLRLGKTILELEKISFYFEEKILFKDFSLKALSNERYGIIGRNGAGKSTLLSIIDKSIEPKEGQVTHGKNTVIIRFDQQREQLDKNLTVKQSINKDGDTIFINNKPIHVSNYLDKFLFNKGDLTKKVSMLSGGEQNRLLIAKLFLTPANCLLLDEPTNDLDVTSLLVLEDMLANYPGVVFVVSHDKRFLDRICTSIIAFENYAQESKLILINGNYSDYLTHKNNLTSSKIVTPAKEAKPKIIKEKLRRSYMEEREFKTMEQTISDHEKILTQIKKQLEDPQVFKDNQKANEIALKLKHEQDLIEELYERWQKLAEMEPN